MGCRSCNIGNFRMKISRNIAVFGLKNNPKPRTANTSIENNRWVRPVGWRSHRTYFFKDEAGANLTVNGERYRAMINDFLTPDAGNWFHKNGATCQDQWIGHQDCLISHLWTFVCGGM
ncbi:uncharacterized protein LOC128868475 [Anastrepha ludens]|uniref:uncharacterized protein LOC128868475 n=1 Tax=Anastrepha ludens TaxID=28586 RepID=UPI0023B1C39F|nr:uncharacterized protein LOC128868475 [Anastrepha ludens]